VYIGKLIIVSLKVQKSSFCANHRQFFDFFNESIAQLLSSFLSALSSILIFILIEKFSFLFWKYLRKVVFRLSTLFKNKDFHYHLLYYQLGAFFKEVLIWGFIYSYFEFLESTFINLLLIPVHCCSYSSQNFLDC